MKPIEETNNILDKLGYAQHGYGIPQNIDELHEFHNQCIKNTIDKAVLRKAIDKNFVCGYEQGLSGAVHSRYCRKCALLKELGLEKEE